MILTVTVNPAVDQTIYVDALTIGDVNRFKSSLLDPAGKGVNASRMAHRLGWPTIAFGFLGGHIGSLVEQALKIEGVPYHFVPIEEETRLNVTVVDEGHSSFTSFYGPGPAVSSQPRQALDSLVEFWLAAGRVLVLAGSLPPGFPEDVYAGYIRKAREREVKTILDASGAPLRAGVEALPDVIKPNVAEAEGLLGRSLTGLPAVVEGAKELAARGIGTVVISMGADGAICVHEDQVWQARPPAVERRSTVGSGDSMVAGLAVGIARGDDVTGGLRLGVAAGAATAMSSGTALGTLDDVNVLLPRVQIERLS